MRWQLPTTIKQLRGFLGLTGYYRRFIKQYAHIAHPMTELLKKDGYVWSEEATISFANLKKAMLSPLVLSYPDFSITFAVETDASQSGIGAVLMQNDHPIAYFSCKLTGKRRKASTYARELFAITRAIAKWRHYLLGRHFIIKTDHRTLKNLLT